MSLLLSCLYFGPTCFKSDLCTALPSLFVRLLPPLVGRSMQAARVLAMFAGIADPMSALLPRASCEANLSPLNRAALGPRAHAPRESEPEASCSLQALL